MLRNVHYARWLLGIAIRQLGFWGLLGLAMAGLSATVIYVKHVHIQQQMNEVQMLIAAQQTQRAVEATHKQDAPIDASQSIRDFYDTFPIADTIPDTLSILNRIALKQGIRLNSGDYKLNKIKVLQGATKPMLTQYEMILPIEGSYQSIRMLMTAVLSEIPSIAITDIRFKRENTLSPYVDAQLVLTLFVRGELT